MSIPYKKIQVQTALRSGQLVGTDAATLEANYTAAWATSSLDGSEVPFSAIRDNILAVEKELAHIIASDKQQPYRQHLYGRSNAVANNALIPLVSNANIEFIGSFSGVVDGSSLKPLIEQPLQTIEDLSASFFDAGNFYYYAFSGERILHTRSTAILEGCCWSLTTQTTQYNTLNGTSPLPQMLENTWIAGVLANLPQEADWYANEGQYYAQVYQNGIQMLKMRDLSAPQLPDYRTSAGKS